MIAPSRRRADAPTRRVDAADERASIAQARRVAQLRASSQ
jgi:hypothetical protein